MANATTTNRLAMIAAIKAASTLAGARIFDTRMRPADPNEAYPFVNVSSGDATESTIGAARTRRRETIDALAYCAGGTDAEIAAQLDELGEQLRKAMRGWALTPVAGAQRFQSVGRVTIRRGPASSETEHRRGFVTASLEVAYDVVDARTTGDSLTRADIDANLPSGEPVDASAQVDLAGG